MSRLLERSHPNVLKTKFKLKKPRQCLVCGVKTLSSSYHKSGPLNEFDSLVESLLIKWCFYVIFYLYLFLRSVSIKYSNLSIGTYIPCMIPNFKILYGS